MFGLSTQWSNPSSRERHGRMLPRRITSAFIVGNETCRLKRREMMQMEGPGMSAVEENVVPSQVLRRKYIVNCR